eukprot:4957203-Amphidinium_carterae.1
MFTGLLPPEGLQGMTDVTLMLAHANHFAGRLPGEWLLRASYLRAILLHSNRLSAALPDIRHRRLKQFGVRDNFFQGALPA